MPDKPGGESLLVADDQAQADGDGPVEPLDTFARRLDYLFRTVHPRGQRPFSYEHVADSITREQGIEISANYIWMLRVGRRDNPTVRHCEGLAGFFGVSPAFFIDTELAERTRSQLDKLSEVAGSGAEHVAFRGSVDEQSLDVLSQLLDQARALAEELRPQRSMPSPDSEADGRT